MPLLELHQSALSDEDTSAALPAFDLVDGEAVVRTDTCDATIQSQPDFTDLTGIRLELVADDDPDLQDLYERCGAYPSYPLGSQACHWAAVVYRDFEFTGFGGQHTLSTPLMAFHAGIVDGEVVVASAALGRRLPSQAKLAVVDHLVAKQEGVAGPCDSSKELDLARMLGNVVRIEEYDPKEYESKWATTYYPCRPAPVTLPVPLVGVLGGEIQVA